MRRPIVAVVVAVVILAAATTGGLLLAACGSSSGSASTAQAAATNAPSGQAPDMSSMLSTALDPLVKAGTITSDQESTVIDALTSSVPSGGQGGQPSAGATPPSGQAPSAGSTPPSGAQGSAPGGQMFSTTLSSLVSDGTITSTQKTAIAKALSSAMQSAGPGSQQTSESSAQSS